MEPRAIEIPPATFQERAGSGQIVQMTGGALRLVNPNNQCYINAIIVACVQWMLTGHSWAGQSVFKRALQQLIGLPLNVRHHVLSLLPFRPCFSNWRRPHVQHDASESLLQVLNGRGDAHNLCKWQSYTQRNGIHDPEDSGSMLIPLSIPSTEDGTTLQECVQAWHVQPSVRDRQRDSLHCIHSAETHVAFVLKRFRQDTRGITKNEIAMQVPPTCALPVYRPDGPAWLDFHVDAIVVHLGPTPHSGHCRCFYRTLTGDTGCTDDGVKAKRPSRADIHSTSRGSYIIMLSRDASRS